MTSINLNALNFSTNIQFPKSLFFFIPFSNPFQSQITRETFPSPLLSDNGNQMKFWYTKSSSER